MQVIGNLKNISMASSKLLLAAKSLSVDPAAANAKNLLAAAARYHNWPHAHLHIVFFNTFIHSVHSVVYLILSTCEVLSVEIVKM